MTWTELTQIMDRIESRGLIYGCEMKTQRDKFHAQKDENPYILTGRYLGYPECCCQAFVKINLLDASWRTSKVKRFSNLYYFLACETCADLIENNWTER